MTNHYVLGIGHPYTETAVNSPPAIYDTDPLTGVVGLAAPGGYPTLINLGINRTVALLGDSITYNNHNNGSTFDPTINSQMGYWTFASQILGKRFYYDSTYNFGVLGDSTTQVLARVGSVIAKGPSLCVVLCGINDIQAGATAATVQTNLMSIWAALNNAGIAVIAGCIFPTTVAGFTAAKAKVLMQVNQWMRVTVPRFANVHLWDSFFNLADLTSTVAACDANCFVADLLHPVRRGAFIAGNDLAAVINSVYPDIGNSTQGAQFGSAGLSDVYDATSNPRGSLVANATLTGTGGTNAGAYATGSVANSWTVFRASGSTIVCVSSKNTITLANGQTYSEQQLVVSSPGGGAATEEISFQQAVTTAVGDNLVAGAWIDVSSLSGRLNYVSARTQAQYASFTILGQDGYYFGGGAQSLPSAFTGNTQTPAVGATACPSGGTSTNASIVIGLDCTVASSVTVKIRLPYARKN